MSLNSVQRCLLQMRAPVEAKGHGFNIPAPWLSWVLPPVGATNMTPWGEVYFDRSGTPAPAGVRVELKNMETWFWSKAQKHWNRISAVKTFAGAHYPESFVGKPVPAPAKIEPDGGQSITMVAGYNYHFYLGTHVPLSNRADIGGLFTTVQARLLGASSAPFVINMGADWWGKPGSIPGTTSGNPASGASKWETLSGAWKAFSYYTGGDVTVLAKALKPGGWKEAEFIAHPPTMDGMGLP